MNGKVLIVDDDESMCDTLATALVRRGFVVTWRTSSVEALAILEGQDFDVVVTDLHMDGMDGIALCKRVVANRPGVPVVMITAFGTLETAVAAIRAGAYDFITKPYDVDLVRLTLARAVQHRQLGEEVARLRHEVRALRGGGKLVGASPAIQKVRDLIERVSDSDASLLISGESGTGKELVARALHERGSRAAGPFVALNCAAMTETLLESELFGHVKGAFTDARVPRQGLFRKASGGTLFLDEIGELPMGMQAKLLRALQEKTVRPVGSDDEEPYDARVLTATNRDIETEVEERRFREDLFYRVNVLHIHVPPLRARGNDVLLLAQTFVERFAAENGKQVRGFSAAVAAKLLGYTWPGNVRELQNCLESAVVLTRFDELSVDDLPEKISDYRPANGAVPGVEPLELVSMDEVERRYILRVLAQVGGSKSAAAQVLGLDRRTLYRKLEQYGELPAGGPEAAPAAG